MLKPAASRITLRISSFAVVFALAACGGTKENRLDDTGDAITECEAYVLSLARCMRRLDTSYSGDAGPGFRRVAVAQSAIATATKEARDDASREALRARCASGVASLSESCR
jgi:hypothetical protein